MVRRSLLPGLLETLTVNAHREYPQRIFEVGECTELDDSPTGASEVRHAAAVVIGERVGAVDVRAAVEAALREQGWGMRTEGAPNPTCLPGRAARIVAVRGEQERDVGVLGELHPEVIENHRLRLPAAFFEVDLSALTDLR